MRATFRIDIAVNYLILASGSLHWPHIDCIPRRRASFCPVCGGAPRTAVAETTEPDAWSARAAGSCSISIRRSPSARSFATSGTHRAGPAGDRPGYGKWVFPGGYVDRGEQVTRPPSARHARNQASTSASIGLINVYSYPLHRRRRLWLMKGCPNHPAPPRPLVIIVYVATMLGGALVFDDEGLEAVMFPATPPSEEQVGFCNTHGLLE